MKLSPLEEKLAYHFKRRELLIQALTHRSYLNENPHFKYEHNERLEFLGDAVLELIVTEHLYRNYRNPEGELTNWRAALVNSRMLSLVAKNLGVNDFLLLSRGEAQDTGRARQLILANTFEAIVGAIYLDGGFEKAKEFIKKHLLVKLKEVLRKKLYQDPKSRFQEKAQEILGITPSYQVLREWGPDHKKQFEVGVYLEKEMIAKGKGFSKQSAEEKAAQKALKIKGW